MRHAKMSDTLGLCLHTGSLYPDADYEEQQKQILKWIHLSIKRR